MSVPDKVPDDDDDDDDDDDICEQFHDIQYHFGASVAQWIANPPRDLQGPFCRGFEPRHRRPGLTEGLKD
ncbi:hypothetical protein PoB_001225900 [Plakobranchus ocellatus]|uniref:Uncharacterized protein n=1 Tax=Plakobranchus ocellatus TaxID=259542 RepID=A0AAV3YRR7_9GAST|nr:hypothetical protein PoB_001225900 [Plakobranchus ocellatus]